MIHMTKNENFDGGAHGYLPRSSIREADAIGDVNDGAEVENSSTLNEPSEKKIRPSTGVSHPESAKEIIYVDATHEFTR
jgi:hypothetical protein